MTDRGADLSVRIRRGENGFSLVEIAVVLVIAGFIFLPLMAVFVQKDMDDRRVQNVEDDERLLNAVNFYFKRNGGYPCAAAMGLGPNDVGFATAGLAGAAQCTGVFSIGALPLMDLGLPFDKAVNVYGWKYIYATNVNVDGQAVPFVIVNPGKDGKGSFTLEGEPNVLGCVLGPNDNENCDGDAQFSQFPQATAMAPTAAGYYDDKVTYGAVSKISDFWIKKDDQTVVGAGNRIVLTNRTRGGINIGGAANANGLSIAATVQPGEPAVAITGQLRNQGGTLNVGQSLIMAEPPVIQRQLTAINYCYGQARDVQDSAGVTTGTQCVNYQPVGSVCPATAPFFDGTHCCTKQALNFEGLCHPPAPQPIP